MSTEALCYSNKEASLYLANALSKAISQALHKRIMVINHVGTEPATATIYCQVFKYMDTLF